jgi:hypothetical protein
MTPTTGNVAFDESSTISWTRHDEQVSALRFTLNSAFQIQHQAQWTGDDSRSGLRDPTPITKSLPKSTPRRNEAKQNQHQQKLMALPSSGVPKDQSCVGQSQFAYPCREELSVSSCWIFTLQKYENISSKQENDLDKEIVGCIRLEAKFLRIQGWVWGEKSQCHGTWQGYLSDRTHIAGDKGANKTTKQAIIEMVTPL